MADDDKLEPIKWQPGRWIDWDGKIPPIIRDAAGRIIATDLQIRDTDIPILARALAKDMGLSEAETEAFMERVNARFFKEGGDDR